MAEFFPPFWDTASPLSETRVREALTALGADWRIFCHVRWLDPESETADGETDFVLVHPLHGILVLEVKGGAFEVRDGAWWTVDQHGSLRPLGRRGPFEQAATAKHRLRRRLTSVCPPAATRVGQAVCFTSGVPTGDLGDEAPPEVTLSQMDLSDLEARLVDAARFLGISDETAPLSSEEIASVTAVLAPRGSVRRDEAREVATFRVRMDTYAAQRLDLTEQQLAGLEKLRRRRRLVIHGGAGTGKTVLAVRRARELLQDGRSVVVLCTSAQLVAHYRTALQGEWPGRLAVGRIGVLLNTDVDVLAAGALLIDEAQNLNDEHLQRLPLAIGDENSDIDLFCDLGQLRDPGRRSLWTVPFEHDAHYLAENLRNSAEIVNVLSKLGYDGVSTAVSASGVPVEMLECANGAAMRAACLQVAFDLIHDGGVRPGQIAILTEAAGEVAALCVSLGINASTDVWAFGRGHRDRLDVGRPESFQGLERDVVIAMEPTVPTSPPALDRPSGSSSLPRSDFDDAQTDEDLRTVLRIPASRARSKLILIGGSKLRTALDLANSDRSIRAEARGQDSTIELHGISPGTTARARASRRRTVADD